MLPPLRPTQTVSSDGQELGEAGLAHVMREVERVAAVHEQHVGLPRTHGTQSSERGSERGDLEHADATSSRARPSGIRGSCPATKSTRAAARPRVAVRRGRDAERVALGDRLAEQVERARRGCSGS